MICALEPNTFRVFSYPTASLRVEARRESLKHKSLGRPRDDMQRCGLTISCYTKPMPGRENIFDQASREVCRDAVRPLLSQVPEEEIPAILR